MIGPQAAALLEAIHEPALLVGRSGAIVHANRAFERLMGGANSGRRLPELVASNSDGLDRYLQRCLGSGEPLVGMLELTVRDGVLRAKCGGCSVRGFDEPLVLLRLTLSSEKGFAALTHTVADLKEELKKRRKSEAMLAEAVRERELLLRELEHRVKNNMQMLSALLSGAERETESEEAKAALKDASIRFSAISAVQQLLYRSQSLTAIDARSLVSTLTEAVASLASRPLETKATADSIDLPVDSAVPLGLILNELLTNAVKHARPPTGIQSVRVELTRDRDSLQLCVADNGRGFELAETGKRASGIGLVRGLLRQLGGSIEVRQSSGALCIVRLPLPSERAVQTQS